MASLALKPLVLVYGYAEGLFAACPAFAPHLVAFGADAEAAEAELVDFLSQYFAELEPDVLQKFLIPEQAELRHVSMTLARGDLPPTHGLRTPLRIPVIEVTARSNARWVLVPSVPHVSYVPLSDPDSIDQVVRDEVVRLVAAAALNGASYLDLFAPMQLELSRPVVEIDPEHRTSDGRERSGARARRAAEALLSQVGRVLTKPVHELLARSTSDLEVLLDGAERRSLVLVGPEGVGKTAWLSAAAAGLSRQVYATSGAELVAGQSGLGQLQERVEAVLRAAELLDAVLYFDSLADLFAGHEGGMEDIARLLRGHVQAGRVRVVGEVSADDYERLSRRHVGIFSHLLRFNVEPLNREQTLAALTARTQRNSRMGERRLDAQALSVVVELSERYEPYKVQPGKAARLFDELSARAALDTSAPPEVELTRAQMLAAFSAKTGIPEFLLRDDRSLLVADVERYLRQYVLGQDHAVTRVAEILCMVKAGLQPTGKPLATLLFLGPTGVGKTELAKALARFLFGSADRMVRFDMSEYTDALAAQRLIRGAERADGALTQRVREQPFGVVLLDEIEKAHSSVFDLLLQVAGEGRLSDARGKVAYFHNTILILTSNLGARHRQMRVGFADETETDDASHYLRQVERHFRPEFVNRLDAIVPFSSLTRDQIAEVARLCVQRIGLRAGLLLRNAELWVSERAVLELAAGGYSREYGARGLRRHLEQALVAPLAALLSELTQQAQGARFLVCACDEDELPEAWQARLTNHRLAELPPHSRGRVTMSVALSRSNDTTVSVAGIAALSAMRRDMRRWGELTPIADARERRAELTVQLAQGGRRLQRTPAQVHALPELAREHAQLDAWLQPLDASVAAIEELETLLFAALDETPPDLLPEATACYDAYRKNLLLALLGLSQADRVTLAIHELDDRKMLHLLLVPLLQFARHREWNVQLHFDRVPRDSGSTAWPRLEDRRWGPPISALDYLANLPTSRSAAAVLVRVRGQAAAALLSFYSGRFRFHEREGYGELLVRYLRSHDELRDQDFLHHDFKLDVDRNVGQRQPLRLRLPAAPDASLPASVAAESLGLVPDQLFERFPELIFDEALRKAAAGESFAPEAPTLEP